MITRRTLTATGLAMAATPTFAQPKKPLVIAHRGASGERPEHTLMAYRLAIAEGCDFIEPDCVVTKDGHLVVRHENEIAGTTDVAGRPEFAARKADKVIDGQKITGWFTEDFTLAELKTLRARERLPQVRPGSAKFDGQEEIPTYQEVVDLAKAESKRVGRTIGTYPEMKHPTYFAGIGLPLEQRLADILKKNDLDSKTAPVFVQCFEVEPLKTFGKLGKARRVMLVGQGPAPVDVKSAAAIKAIAAFAEGLGPEWPLVIPTAGGTLGAPTELVGWAHAAGLAVHPWTVRAENMFLPKSLQRGTSPADHGDVEAVFKAIYAAGVDGLFSDFPGLAVKARG
ncbi:MAG: glycerophosphodiester phosphodiesterase [Alphaproteobacteria bacterium]|nr:glycerophosphodiester phosphodiesterase [Alphaproteobacteria bacterium]MBU1514085.1 glycerophosphodiester phosphodiesterase [Alphaproteobacteria bacterium]MBU2096266.1 glycerophosphodiester phosphodiesterase [Alphaproteobacteria bacterium]MBU2152736.1 glycerophosphodiester phosphodiesterase [Alphaproteobacteria bacterium]MBU2308960.1 glycerophosphodiester phosphodiesterase [Alphaproteobacteria bacterium]